MKYDSNIIQEFAEKLYAEANSIIFEYTMYGLIIGGIIGAAIDYALNSRNHFGLLISAIILGFIGYSKGRKKAFYLKLQAQTAMCQVQIERNTNSRT